MISILLFACRTEYIQPTQIVRQTEKVTTTFTASPSKTKTLSPPSSTSTQTLLPSKTASQTPTVTLTPSETVEQQEFWEASDEECMGKNPDVTIMHDIFQEPEFEYIIAGFLNDGGIPEGLENHLDSSETSVDPNLIQITILDMNLDGIQDVLITITLHHFDSYGETHVLAYICDMGQYETTILFRRAGAGSRAEGLYAGGGAKVELAEDMNQDGGVDILFSVNWPGYAEYYLMSWVNGEFASLIEYTDILGTTRYSFNVAPGNVRVEDVDKDGVYEFVVTAMNYQTMTEETNYWYWDGEKYSLPFE
jgi:hypothetical protein